MKKEICLCINKINRNIHAVGVWHDDNKQYYDSNMFLWFDLSNKRIFEYKEISNDEFKEIIKNGLN